MLRDYRRTRGQEQSAWRYREQLAQESETVRCAECDRTEREVGHAFADGRHGAAGYQVRCRDCRVLAEAEKERAS